MKIIASKLQRTVEIFKCIKFKLLFIKEAINYVKLIYLYNSRKETRI